MQDGLTLGPGEIMRLKKFCGSHVHWPECILRLQRMLLYLEGINTTTEWDQNTYFLVDDRLAGCC